MVQAKSKFTYFTWVLYLVLLLGTIMVASYGLTEKMGNTGDIMFIGMGLLGIISFVLAINLIAFVIKKLFPMNGNFSLSNNYTEVILVVFITVLSFMIRFIYLANQKGTISGSTNLYNTAVLMNFNGIDFASNGERIYTRVISFLFSTFGKKEVIAMYFQVALQVIMVLSLYITLRSLIGMFSGAVATCIFTFIPYIYSNISHIDSEGFVAMFNAVAILFITLGVKYANKPEHNPAQFIGFLVAGGLLGGFSGFLDISGLCLIVLGISLIIWGQRNDEAVTGFNPVILILAFLVTYIAGYVLSYMFLGGSSIGSFVNVIINDFNGYIGGIKMNLYINSPAYATYSAIIIVGFAVIWAERIFNCQRDLGSPFVLYGFLLALLSFLSISSSNLGFFTTYVWCIFASIGIASLSDKSLDDAYEYIREREKARSHALADKRAYKNNIRSKVKAAKIDASAASTDISLNSKKDEVPTLDFLTENKDEYARKIEEERRLAKEAEEAKKASSNSKSKIKDNGTSKPSMASELTKNVEAPKPVAAPKPAETPKPVEAPKPIETPKPVETPKPIETPRPATPNPRPRISAPVPAPIPAAPAPAPVPAPAPAPFPAPAPAPAPIPAAPTPAPAPAPVAAPKPEAPTPAPVPIPTAPTPAPAPMPKAEEVAAPTPAPAPVPAPAPAADKIQDVQTKINSKPTVDNSKTNSVTDNTQVENTENPDVPAVTPASAPENKAESPYIPVMKFGRRKDYKTAVVKTGNENPIINHDGEKVKPNTVDLSGTRIVEASSLTGLKKNEPIHNPLPTPKKHVPKDMDYDVIIADNDMHFDLVDLKDNDYFDIN